MNFYHAFNFSSDTASIAASEDGNLSDTSIAPSVKTERKGYGFIILSILYDFASSLLNCFHNVIQMRGQITSFVEKGSVFPVDTNQ